MATYIDITQNILSQNNICFETRTINKELINVPLEDANFGILDFKAVTSNETMDVLEFIFIIDCSGSMSDMCSDGRTKMQHITHTLKNMIIFFYENSSINVFITINAFDTEIYKIIKRTKVTIENFASILSSIDDVYPRGTTDIEYALINSAKEINQIKKIFPTHKISHIFMTDGEATAGSNDITKLQSYITLDVTNIFIGFGIDHDSVLLNGISSVGKSAYYFIDKLESAGLVYGEILHSIVHKVLTEPEITIKNGLIYDYKTNTWVEKLRICDIVSESNKLFNIASNNPDQCTVEIKANQTDDITIIFPSVRIENAELTLHLYRQRTLQLLFEVNEFLNKNREKRMKNNNSCNIFSHVPIQRNSNGLREQKNIIKKKLFNFITEMKDYMSENNLENDKILKNLCDDIYVCYRTFDTKYGFMFCTARQTSQGTQRIYTASNTNDTDDNNLNQQTNQLYRFNRPVNINFDDYHNIINDNDNTNLSLNLHDIHHELSNFADTPYLTPQATNVIRSISAPSQDDDEDLLGLDNHDFEEENRQKTFKIN
jgi:hypothetical protein